MKKFILTPLLAIALVAIAFTGCKAPTDVAYFQDMHETQAAAVQHARDIRITPLDKLVLNIKSKDQELSMMLSLNIGNTSNTQGPQSQFAYTVDYDGNIDIPQLGKVQVGGLTRIEAAAHIKEQLIARKVVLDPVVIVEFKDLVFSVLGEVKNPGRQTITRDHITLTEALAMAGDLQITGERRNVSVIRMENGQEKHYYVDLTNAATLYQSPAFYIQQNDVVYVEPNPKRMRESRPNGNTFNTASFWVSIVSMVASVTSIVVGLTRR